MRLWVAPVLTHVWGSQRIPRNPKSAWVPKMIDLDDLYGVLSWFLGTPPYLQSSLGVVETSPSHLLQFLWVHKWSTSISGAFLIHQRVTHSSGCKKMQHMWWWLWWHSKIPRKYRLASPAFHVLQRILPLGSVIMWILSPKITRVWLVKTYPDLLSSHNKLQEYNPLVI